VNASSRHTHRSLLLLAAAVATTVATSGCADGPPSRDPGSGDFATSAEGTGAQGTGGEDTGGAASSVSASSAASRGSEDSGDAATTSPQGSTGTSSTGAGDGEDDGGSTGAVIYDVGMSGDDDPVATTTGGSGECPDECHADAVGQAAGDWLLHLAGDGELAMVFVADGTTEALCTVQGLAGALSLTFTRDNRLMASNGSDLYEIDPCSCIASEIGAFTHGGIFSSSAGKLVRIDTSDGSTTEVGDLGVMFGTHGATWSEEDATLYAINGSDDELYDVDQATGAASPVGPLGVGFFTVGVEVHPASGLLYGCTGNGGQLYGIDKLAGTATFIGDMGVVGSCTNLGAPWSTSDVCLPPPQ
jgi:hypothetical protein